MNNPDKRLHLYRQDLADAALRGRIEAQRFAEGRPSPTLTHINASNTGPAR
jgi:hypothetical protein